MQYERKMKLILETYLINWNREKSHDDIKTFKTRTNFGKYYKNLVSGSTNHFKIAIS